MTTEPMMSPESAVDQLERASPARRVAFVDWLHDGILVRSPRFRPRVVPEGHEAWTTLEQAIHTAHPGLRARVVALVETHAETAGALDLIRLIQDAWNDLSPLARGRVLAGVSSRLASPGRPEGSQDGGPVVPRGMTLVEALSHATLDAESAVEIGCHAIRADRIELLTAVLAHGDFAGGHVPRSQRDVREGDWDSELATLSVRPLDILLEAAVRLVRPTSARLLLERGANPNIECWTVERSYNGHHSALSHSIAGVSGGVADKRREVTSLLLDHGADPRGSAREGRNCPLLHALLAGDWALADRLLDLGARFEGGLRYVGTENSSGPEPVVTDQLLAPSYRRDDLEVVMHEIAPRTPLAGIGDVPLYHLPGAQGGHVMTFLHAFLAADRIHRIDHYERRGLATVLTPMLLLDIVRGTHDAALERLMPDELARAHVRRWLNRS